jgi:hypothetical protein
VRSIDVDEVKIKSEFEEANIMFHSFENQAERRAYGGSAFIEFQYCKVKNGTPEKKIVSVNSVRHWQDDSLYVYIDDIENFLHYYGPFFINGLYNNMQHGEIDMYGINYYTPSQVIESIYAIESIKPPEYSMVLNWLKNASKYNGIYILGI